MTKRIAAGPMVTTQIAGKMQNTSGKTIFTPVFAAASSARWRRLVRRVSEYTCWMRFPIDVIALDDKGVIIDRVVNLKPWRIRLPRRGAGAVLELRAGTLDAAGAHIGHRIEFAQGSSR